MTLPRIFTDIYASSPISKRRNRSHSGADSYDKFCWKCNPRQSAFIRGKVKRASVAFFNYSGGMGNVITG